MPTLVYIEIIIPIIVARANEVYPVLGESHIIQVVGEFRNQSTHNKHAWVL